jgi:hypothetical protein
MRRSDDFVAQQRMAFLGVKSTDRQASLTPVQMRDLAQAELVWMQAAAKRGDLVPVDEMVDLLDGIFSEMRAGLDGFPDWLEREFSLSPDQVERAVAFCDGILSEVSDKIAAAHLSEAGHGRGDNYTGLF